MSVTWTHTGYAQRVHFGIDAIDRAAEVLKEVSGRRAMLVTTKGRLASPAGERLIRTLGRPIRVSAETGMDALAHGVECAYSRDASPEARAVALACVQRVAAALPDVVDQPDDLGARIALLEGSALGGRCLLNGTLGVHHGLAQLVGGRTGIPHGLASAILLSQVIRFNLE